jgi:hypothetical protein
MGTNGRRYSVARNFRTFFELDVFDCGSGVRIFILIAIVNHKLAEHCWPGSDPVGKRLRLGLQEAKIPWLTVVGEVADVKEASPDVPGKQQYYLPVEQYEKSIGPFGSPTDLNGNGARADRKCSPRHSPLH